MVGCNIKPSKWLLGGVDLKAEKGANQWWRKGSVEVPSECRSSPAWAMEAGRLAALSLPDSVFNMQQTYPLSNTLPQIFVSGDLGAEPHSAQGTPCYT